MNQQSSVPESDDQGVRIPPPLVYVIALLIGAAMHRFIPVIVIPGGLSSWVGGLLVLLAVIIAILSFREFGKANTTSRHDRPVTALVTTGIYGYSRNPNYISMGLLFFGIGIWLNNVWMIILFVLVFIWIASKVVIAEEQYLLKRFGQAYSDYQTKVRRWI
jgi:protein-S-isoprenylcysteine O-methyltransferase Ste14